ncbi:MAG: enoyl-CoA hydratase/isomerase family protein [Paracoccaceae bacterium]
MTTLADYQNKYPEFAISRDQAGVLHLRFHTDGDAWIWSAQGHRLLGDVMLDIDADRENRLLVLSGTGANFLGAIDLPSFKGIAWDVLTWEAKRYLWAMLNLEIPVIAAVQGKCTIHAETALMSDMIIASDDAQFGDAAHLPRDVVPGDGTQIVWSTLLGVNRARHMLFAEKILSASEALEYGLIGEVAPRDAVLARAMEHAQRIAAKPSVVARNTRTALLRPLRRAFEADMAMGMALQGAAYANRPHRGEVPVEPDDA